jgi:hypothetical protein
MTSATIRDTRFPALFRLASTWASTWAMAVTLLPAWLPAQAPKSNQSATKPPAGNLDHQLFDDLGPVMKPGSDNRPNRHPSPVPAGEDVGQRSESANRLEEIGRKMRQSGARLHQRDTSDSTRGLQATIAADLANWIEEYERLPREKSSAEPARAVSQTDQANQSQAGTAPADGESAGSSKPGRQATAPSDEEARRAAQAVWGTLPDRVRQQLQQMANEEFLPEFADVIRAYYQRLSERGNRRP